MSNATAPFRIAVVLFPALAPLDMFGPLQALNALANEHAMTLSLLSTDMEPISMARNITDGVYYGDPDRASPYFTQFVLPSHTFDNAGDFDMILVPGGGGTFNLTGTQPHVDWLRDRMQDPGLSYMLSVCSGAALLTRTGEMAGKNATTNKATWDLVRSVQYAEDVNWIAKARWVVDGNVWTSSGVSAGTDMILAWIEHVYGRNESERIRIGMEWNALNATDDPFAGEYGLE
ncbi:hypothetical protein jhhlp_007519 [Lomentospora prolificans]|uniref:DJ-1/PfpI domain-containing protein n=1 Tax=Lomentospora prolificans TaxID=41688 RepID=A0A2N3N1C0_9PEZI|nr:hypothetical protein jhhlp_007519 [Lomentospora prolificans]